MKLKKEARKSLSSTLIKWAGENEPTNPKLWEKLQKLTKGEVKSVTHNGKTIQGPNDGKGFEVFPCVPLDSEALTPDGWKGYEDLCVGDEILTFNLENQCFEWGEIEYLHFYESAPVKRMYKSTTGWDIVCTENHKWVIQARNGSLSKGDPNLWGPVTLTEFKNLKKNHKIVTSAQPLTDRTAEQQMVGFSKYGDSWVTKIINMTPAERHAFFAAGIVFDGHEHNQKTVKTYGGSQKNSDHADAFALAGYLSGYNVSFNKKKYDVSITAFTFTSRRHQCLVNLIVEDAGIADVWCPSTKNQTWVMRQKKSITITGNSAYANGWCAKVYKDLGGGWKKAAKSKRDKGSEHGGLDAWFSGHGQGKSKAKGKAPYGDWIAITPVKNTVEKEDGSEKTYEAGDIVGPCGISKDPNWKDITNNGKDPLKCMPRQKAHDLSKVERAELAKHKRKKEQQNPDTGKPVNTPTFGEKAKEIKKRAEGFHMKNKIADELNKLEKIINAKSSGVWDGMGEWSQSDSIEGEWSHSHKITPKGLYGLDTSEHRNEGYQLVKAPSEITRALIGIGVLKKIKSVSFSPNWGWTVTFENGAFEARGIDFKKLVTSGLSGVRVDRDQTIIYFNEQ